MSSKRKQKYDDRGDRDQSKQDYRRIPQPDNRGQRWQEDPHGHVKKGQRIKQHYEQEDQYKYQGMPKPRFQNYQQNSDRNPLPPPKYKQENSQNYSGKTRHDYQDESIKYEQKQHYIPRSKSRESSHHQHQQSYEYDYHDKEHKKVGNFVSDKRASVSHSPSVGSRVRSPSYSSNDSYARKKSSNKHRHSQEVLQVYQRSPEKVKVKRERGRSHEKKKQPVQEKMLTKISVEKKQENRKHLKKKKMDSDNSVEKTEKLSHKKRKRVASSPETSEKPMKKMKTHKKSINDDYPLQKKEKKHKKEHHQENVEQEYVETSHYHKVSTGDSEYDEGTHKKKSFNRKSSGKQHSSSRSVETSKSTFSRSETEFESQTKTKKKKQSKHQLEDRDVEPKKVVRAPEEELKKIKLKKKKPRESMTHEIDEQSKVVVPVYKTSKDVNKSQEEPPRSQVFKHSQEDLHYKKLPRHVKQEVLHDDYEQRYVQERHYHEKHREETYVNMKQEYEKQEGSRSNRMLKSAVKYTNETPAQQKQQTEPSSYQNLPNSSYKPRIVEKVYDQRTPKEYKHDREQDFDERYDEQQYETKVKVMRHTSAGRPDREVVYQPTRSQLHRDQDVRKHSDSFSRQHDNMRYPQRQQQHNYKNISYSDNRAHPIQSVPVQVRDHGRTNVDQERDFQYKSRTVRQPGNYDRKNTDVHYIKKQPYNNQSNNKFREGGTQQGNVFYKKPYNDNHTTFQGNRQMQQNDRDRPIVYDDRKKFDNRKMNYQSHTIGERRQMFVQRTQNREFYKQFEKPVPNRQFDNQKYVSHQRGDVFKQAIIVKDDRIPHLHRFDGHRRQEGTQHLHKQFHESSVPSSSASGYTDMNPLKYRTYKHIVEEKRSRSSSSKGHDRRDSHSASRRSVSKGDKSSHRSDLHQSRKRPRSSTKEDEHRNKRSKINPPESKSSETSKEKVVTKKELHEEDFRQNISNKHPADPLEVDWGMTEDRSVEKKTGETGTEEELGAVLRRFTPANLLRESGFMANLLPDDLVARCHALLDENQNNKLDKALNIHLRDITKRFNCVTDSKLRHYLNHKVEGYQHKLVPPLVLNGKTYGISVKHYINCMETPREL